MNVHVDKYIYFQEDTEETTVEQGLELNYENYKASEGKLSLYVNHNQTSGKIFLSEEVTVAIGEQDAVVEKVDSFQNMDEGISYVCLVDVSGSLDDARMSQMKTVLTTLNENKGEKDSICVIAMGDELRSSGFLTDKEEINGAIDELQVLNEDTNLYQGIKDALSTLNSEGVSAKRCLVVMSDGAEDNTYGITKAEVDAIVVDSHVPVYTVGMLGNAGNQSQVENIKVLGSFARMSSGGEHYVPVLNEIEPEEVAQSIQADLLAGQVITVDTSDLTVSGKEVYLQISVTGDMGQASVGVNIPDKNIIIEKKAEETSDTTEATEATTEVVTEEPGSDEGFSSLAVGGIIGVVVVLIILVICLTRKKKNEEEIEGLDEIEKNESAENQEQIGATEGPVAEQSDEAGEDEDLIKLNVNRIQPDVDMGFAVGKGISVRFVRMGQNQTKTYSVHIVGRLSLGRNNEADLSISDDRILSGVHCIFEYRDGGLYVVDNMSTNGTYVNGVPVKKETKLCHDDVLLAGSHEYRICFDK